MRKQKVTQTNVWVIWKEKLSKISFVISEIAEKMSNSENRLNSNLGSFDGNLLYSSHLESKNRKSKFHGIAE